MSQYYLDTMKQAVKDPAMTQEKLLQIMEECQFFFGVLRVKFESQNPVLCEEAKREIAELEAFLAEHLSPVLDKK